MNIDHFDDLLAAAARQGPHERLLLVFVAAELPEDAQAEQRAHHAAGRGGTLTPLVCVDKSPAELESFAALAAEAEQFNLPWQLVFAAALSGQGGAPAPQQIDAALERMVADIKAGRIEQMIPFDRQGQPQALRAG